MSDFRTVLSTSRSPVRMAISDRIFTIGSCFSDTIGARLAAHKMRVLANPAGVMYNPVSIHHILELAIQGAHPSGDGYTEGEVISHFDFHSALSDPSRDALEHRLVQTLSDCRDALREANWLIITYGSAAIYTRRVNNKVVANCHKQPASTFVKSTLSPAEVESSFAHLLRAARLFNPALKVILTVSPVRHIKDTLEGNAISKSILRVACSNIVNTHPDVFYFPAYEIMLDDLRDYRFYAADMIHPNTVATDYIWEKFGNVWFDDQLLVFMDSWKGILKALQHRPFHPHTEAHRQFVSATLKRLVAWADLVDVTAEANALHQQLKE